jgi:ubiquinone/menaquinone biosynthesis C-methylase UbiE
MSTELLSHFERVNKLETPESVISFLEITETMPFTQECKERMRELAPVLPGQHVLDVGCGLGQEARRLSTLAGANGRVVGIDASEAAIAGARRQNAAPALEFVHGYADRLPFDDASFDVVRSERVAEYVNSPQGMLAEMYRVLRRNGRMLVFDFDYSGMIIDARNRALADRINQLIAGTVPNPHIGGQLWGHFVRLRLRNLRVVPMNLVMPFELYDVMTRATVDELVERGELGENESRTWWNELEQSHREGAFFATLTGMIVCGVK